jgi:hypothetical protein
MVSSCVIMSGHRAVVDRDRRARAPADVASSDRRARAPAGARRRPFLRSNHLAAIVLALLLFAVPGIGVVTRLTEDHAFFPLEVVLEQTELLLNADSELVLSAEHLNRLAGSLALHGRFIPAERALATSLRLYPKQGDALFLLAALRCAASRLGEARDALYKAYHSRAMSNAHEAAAVNSATMLKSPFK